MSNLCAPGSAGCPVRAGGILPGRKSPAVGPRACEDVVLVSRVVNAADLIEPFGDGGFLADLVTVVVEVFDVRGDQQTFGVVPRPSPDPIACVHGRLAAQGRCTRGRRARCDLPNLRRWRAPDSARRRPQARQDCRPCPFPGCSRRTLSRTSCRPSRAIEERLDCRPRQLSRTAPSVGRQRRRSREAQHTH